MINISERILEYLTLKLKNFVQSNKGGRREFLCPNITRHKFPSKNPTATFLTGSDKIICPICEWKGTAFDVVRLIEEDKKNKSDAEITEYLISLLDLDEYKELDEYVKYGWALIPLLKNDRVPFEPEWQKSDRREKLAWVKWLNNGLNVGVNCGTSQILAIDVDFKATPATETDQLYKQLIEANTLMQSTPHGKHFVFKQDTDFGNWVNIGGLHIDTRSVDGQIAIAPSKRDGLVYAWLNLGSEIKTLPTDIKQKLLDLKQVDKGRNTKISLSEAQTVKEGEGRNNILMSIGGVIINKFSAEDTAYILSLISKNFMSPELPFHEIKAMLGSLEGYKISTEEGQERAVYEYIKLIQNDVSAKDIMDSLRLPRNIVDKYLSKFVKAGKAIRLGRGRYQYKEKIEWSDSTPEVIQEYQYKMPLFNNIAVFQDADCLILGGKTNQGKTTIALNIIKEMIEQGVKPYYIFNEAGCYDKETEILTDKGWKYFKDLDKTEEVITLNPKTKHIEYQKPSNYFVYNYTGDLIEIKSRYLDLLLTPNHQQPVFLRNNRDIKFYKAEEAPISNGIPKIGTWTGKTPKYFTLSKVSTEWYSGINLKTPRSIKLDNLDIEIEPWLEFLGIYLAEGCCSESTRISISQMTKCKEVENILKKLPFKYYYTGHQFRISDKRLAIYLSKFGKSYEKYIPQFIKELSPELIEHFLYAYCLGDGHIENQNKLRRYFTTSSRLANDLQELILKRGYFANISIRKVKGTYCYKYEKQHDLYIISEIKELNKALILSRNKVYYNDKVYCIEIPKFHIIYVRRNGKAAWSGNSRFQKTAQMLGIAGKFYHSQHSNPLAVELEANSFSIIDWLCLENKAETDTVLKHLNDELQRKRGILIIFTQLKQDNGYFAPNLIDHFPTFAARYFQDNDTHTAGHWQADKIKEPRGNYTVYNLECVYDQSTRIFKPKDLT